MYKDFFEYDLDDMLKHYEIENPSEWKNEWVYVEIEPTTKDSSMKEFLESYKDKIEEIMEAFLNT